MQQRLRLFFSRGELEPWGAGAVGEQGMQWAGDVGSADPGRMHESKGFPSGDDVNPAWLTVDYTTTIPSFAVHKVMQDLQRQQYGTVFRGFHAPLQVEPVA